MECTSLQFTHIRVEAASVVLGLRAFCEMETLLTAQQRQAAGMAA